MTERVSIQEAAERLGVSPDTVRRRLKKGELAGEKEPTPQGFIWRIELPVEATEPAPALDEATIAEAAAEVLSEAIELARLRERVTGLERLADELQRERDAWQEQAVRAQEAERELRILLRQAQILALPSNTDASGVPQAAPEASERAGAKDSSLSPLKDHRTRLQAIWAFLRGGE